MKLPGATASYDRGEILRKAEKYRSQRRIRKAIREYEKILSADPQDIDVHIRIAPVYIRVGRKDQAKTSLRQVIAWYEKQGFTEKAIATLRLALNPHFSPGFYCGGGYGHVYCVALGRAPRRSVNYASGALGRAPCIHAHLHHLATNPGEKCGLRSTTATLPRT